MSYRRAYGEEQAASDNRDTSPKTSTPIERVADEARVEQKRETSSRASAKKSHASSFSSSLRSASIILKPTRTLLCYICITTATLYLAHLSDVYHLHAKYALLTAATFWIAAELSLFTARSSAYRCALFVWLFWIYTIAALDNYWIIDTRTAISGDNSRSLAHSGKHSLYTACLDIDRRTSSIVKPQLYVTRVDASTGDAPNSTTSIDKRAKLSYVEARTLSVGALADSDPDTFAVVLHHLQHIGRVELCSSASAHDDSLGGGDDGHSKQAVFPVNSYSHARIPYAHWFYRACLLTLISCSLKSCIEYYQFGRSSYTTVYVSVYAVGVTLMPIPQQSLLEEYIATLCVCSATFFFTLGAATRSISSRVVVDTSLLAKEYANEENAVRSGDDERDDEHGSGANDAKQQKIQLTRRLELSRIVQCAWILFAWDYWILIPSFSIQVYLYYRIMYASAKYRAREQQRQRELAALARRKSTRQEQAIGRTRAEQSNVVKKPVDIRVERPSAQSPSVARVASANDARSDDAGVARDEQAQAPDSEKKQKTFGAYVKERRQIH